MKIIPFENSFMKETDCVITIGAFDGLHLGHQKIIKDTVNLAKEKNAKSVVITFNTNPKMATSSMVFSKPLMMEEDENDFYKKMGIDYLSIIDFSKKMSKLTGVEFIAELCKLYRIQAMIIGKDFKCGSKEHSVSALKIKDLVKDFAFGAPVLLEDFVVNSDKAIISSSLVRTKLHEGKINVVNSLLGRHYCLNTKNTRFKYENGMMTIFTDSFMQFVPKDGQYKTKVIAGKKVFEDLNVIISGSCLSFQLSESVEPDRIYFLRSNQE